MNETITAHAFVVGGHALVRRHKGIESAHIDILAQRESMGEDCGTICAPSLMAVVGQYVQWAGRGRV